MFNYKNKTFGDLRLPLKLIEVTSYQGNQTIEPHQGGKGTKQGHEPCHPFPAFAPIYDYGKMTSNADMDKNAVFL